jgi:DNA polymerase-1
MYAPVAAALGVDRATAKVAVLGAMYGQTTGHGAHALRRLEAAYPVAMTYLLDADVAGQTARDLRTYGGRAIRMGSGQTDGMSDRDARSRAAARGRYGRNAMVQGAAAEFFKVWAVTVRARAAALDAHVVLCLHDELLVHAPDDRAERVADLLHACLAEAAHRWAPNDSVRFVADVSVVKRWSDAKP